MNARNKRLLRWVKIGLWTAYAVDWLGGVGSHLLFGGTPANMVWAAPVFLLLATLLVVVADLEDWRALLISFVIGFLAEAIGVATGYPFGSYVYTAVLAPTVLGVAPVVAGAWLILIALVRQLDLPIWAGGLAMVAMDLVIDPLAANTLEFWHWRHPGPYYGIPLTNFAGWFLVSVLILAILRSTPKPNRELVTIGGSILIFFVLVGLAHRYLAPVSLGVLLCGAGYWRWRSSIRSTRI